jgi:hypothetical protein
MFGTMTITALAANPGDVVQVRNPRMTHKWELGIVDTCQYILTRKTQQPMWTYTVTLQRRSAADRVMRVTVAAPELRLTDPSRT